MKAGATLANALWLAGSGAETLRYHRALRQPESAQLSWLGHQLKRHASSEYGRRYGFDGIRDYPCFARRIPLTDYAQLAPAIQRIRRGESDVLASGRVTHLAPTSGTTSASKLIPFTATLQRSFRAAIAPWLADLARQRPALLGGPAYWSISPQIAAPGESAQPREIPVGYADDADYLGGASAWLIRQALAVPGSIRLLQDVDAFWFLTLLCLLRQPELRMISVWHPSFLELLLAAAESRWPELLDAVERGVHPSAAARSSPELHGLSAMPDPGRAAALGRIGPGDWTRWWPRLQVVSCWGEQAAEPGWRTLKRELPRVLVQAKGLLATEAVVTLPINDSKPLAVTSHFFEFLDQRGDVRLAHQLEKGKSYHVVVSNGGGLWRYRLGDQVECDGHVHATPSLRFLGRSGRVSDLRGEKLSEALVYQALQSLCAGTPPPALAMVAACERGRQAHYELLICGAQQLGGLQIVAEKLERILCDNPHYALARRLGQLGRLRAREVAPETARNQLLAHQGRLGDAKPHILLTAQDGWQ